MMQQLTRGRWQWRGREEDRVERYWWGGWVVKPTELDLGLHMEDEEKEDRSAWLVELWHSTLEGMALLQFV